MNDLNEIQCFVSAVELKSFTAAAKALGLPKSSVSRKIKNLEDRLKTTLLIRTTRSLRVTDIGEKYYRSASRALQEIAGVELELNESHDRVEGTLRITAPTILAHGPLNRLIASYLKKYPDVEIEVELTDQIVDLISEGFDFGIRGGKQQDSSLRIRKFFAFEVQLVASPSYFPGRMPKELDEVDVQDIFTFSLNQIPRKIPLKKGSRRKLIKPKGRVVVNDFMLMKELVKNGVGIGAMPTF